MFCFLLVKKKKIVSLVEEGIGEFRHFTTLDGRMLVGDKIGERVMRREDICKPIDFCAGAPEQTAGFWIKRVERTKDNVYFYTIEYYANLRKYSPDHKKGR